jgi:hypothetical protein
MDVFEGGLERGTGIDTEEEAWSKKAGRFGREAGSVVSQAFIVNRINNANP